LDRGDEEALVFPEGDICQVVAKTFAKDSANGPAGGLVKVWCNEASANRDQGGCCKCQVKINLMMSFFSSRGLCIADCLDTYSHH